MRTRPASGHGGVKVASTLSAPTSFFSAMPDGVDVPPPCALPSSSSARIAAGMTPKVLTATPSAAEASSTPLLAPCATASASPAGAGTALIAQRQSVALLAMQCCATAREAQLTRRMMMNLVTTLDDLPVVVAHELTSPTGSPVALVLGPLHLPAGVVLGTR